MSTTQQKLDAWVGHDLVDETGTKIGKIEQIYVEDDSGQPEWLTVSTGMFGTKETFVPLRGMTSDGGVLVSPWDKSTVKDAPNIDADELLTEEEQARLYQHYGRGPGSSETRGTTSGDTARTGDDGGSVTRSEEELKVDTTTQQAGKVTLKKWIETEHQTITVPVRTEKGRVVRETITDGEAGGTLTEESEEMILAEEEVSVDKQVVAKERVRLEKDVEVEDRKVEADVQKERIEVDGDVEGDPKRR